MYIKTNDMNGWYLCVALQPHFIAFLCSIHRLLMLDHTEIIICSSMHVVQHAPSAALFLADELIVQCVRGFVLKALKCRNKLLGFYGIVTSPVYSCMKSPAFKASPAKTPHPSITLLTPNKRR